MGNCLERRFPPKSSGVELVGGSAPGFCSTVVLGNALVSVKQLFHAVSSRLFATKENQASLYLIEAAAAQSMQHEKKALQKLIEAAAAQGMVSPSPHPMPPKMEATVAAAISTHAQGIEEHDSPAGATSFPGFDLAVKLRWMNLNVDEKDVSSLPTSPAASVPYVEADVTRISTTPVTGQAALARAREATGTGVGAGTERASPMGQPAPSAPAPPSAAAGGEPSFLGRAASDTVALEMSRAASKAPAAGPAAPVRAASESSVAVQRPAPLKPSRRSFSRRPRDVAAFDVQLESALSPDGMSVRVEVGSHGLSFWRPDSDDELLKVIPLEHLTQWGAKNGCEVVVVYSEDLTAFNRIVLHTSNADHAPQIKRILTSAAQVRAANLTAKLARPAYASRWMGLQTAGRPASGRFLRGLQSSGRLFRSGKALNSDRTQAD